jgi:hypothetical protein
LAAPAFTGSGLQTAVRRGLILIGDVCVAGLLGPVLGHLRFQLLGIGGYAVVFPRACLLLAILFGRPEPGAAADGGRGAGSLRC